MKKKFTLLIAALALLTMMVQPGKVMGQTSVTFTAGTDTGETSVTKNGITVSMSTMSRTDNYRTYANTDMTVSSTVGNIQSVVVTCTANGTSNYGPGKFSVSANSSGTYTYESDGPNGTWTGESDQMALKASAQVRMTQIVVTYDDGGSSLEDNDLALTSAPVELSFDLYNNSDAQVISYTTSSTGAVTIANNNYVETEVDQVNKTITVTPAAITNGAKTITVNQAADDNYYAGSTTFTVIITDSTPSTGGDVTFVAGVDKGSTTTTGEDEMTKSGVTVYSTSAALATSEYRFYSGSSTTISTTNGNITRIEFTGASSSYPVSRFSTTTGSYESGVWTGDASSIVFSANGQVRVSQIVVTVTTSSEPYITASDVDIAYNATEGQIEYTIGNPDDNATLEVEVADGATIANFTLGTVGDSSIPFTCNANNESTERTATVTLNYVKNEQTLATKEVTVTQAAAPVVYSTIPELFAAATITETNVLVTFNDWVVSGVSTNGKNVFVTDNSGNGFVIFSNDDMSQTYPAGSILAGTAVSCTLKKYNGFAELLNVNADDLTITDGGTVTAAEVAMADLTGVNTGALLHYENLTCNIDNNKYYLTDGTTTLQVYNALYAFEALEDGNTYNITGVYQQYNNTKEILPRSADDIEEVIVTVPSVTVTPNEINAPAEGADGTLALTYENITDFIAFDYYFCDATGDALDVDPDWIDAEIQEDSLYYLIDANDGEARTAYIKVYTYDDEQEEVSAIVTINQAEYVAPTYAELPFEFDGGRADIEGTDGLYQEGLGSDYNNSPKLKFDGTGDWVLLQFTERPGTLTFDIKGNSFSGGTFTVQTSEDGATYTDLENYTNDNFGNTLHSEEFDNLDENVRYIKWIYTEKVNGNVALGNITLAEYTEPVATITVDPDEVNVDAEEHDGTLDLTYEHMTITSMDDFDIQFYDAEEAETDEPDWIEVLVAEQDPSIGDGYVVSYYMIENEGDARTAYFKVFATDDSEFVYSNLVTINQAAYVPTPTGVTYTLVTDASQIVSGKHYIIASGIDGDVKAMGGQQTNNRAVVDVTAVNNSIVAVDLYEFVINGPQTIEEESYFTIYDTNVESTGYLYAAGAGGSGSNNHLKTRATNANDDKGIWTIAINNNKATIKAKAINRNTIRYNANSKCFSCYASGQADVYLFVKDNDTDYEYYGCEITYSGDNIPADETITIGAGSVMGVTNTFTNTDPTNLIIEEGGQLIHNQPVAATIQKNITGYNTSRDAGNSAYQLIASPVADPLIVATETNLTTSGEFDLYIFDENQPEKEWRNYKKTGEFTTIENGKGYLYANANNATISIAGTFKPSASDVTVNLAYTDGNRFAGWNLVGNPFACNAYANDTTGKELAFYKMNSAGDGFVAVTNGAIAPMEGIFVKASATGQSFIFSRQEAPVSSQGNGNLNIQVAQAVTNRDAQPSFDNAIIRFDGGNDLEKFSFSDDNDKLYIPQNGKDYAVVRSEARGEMPVNFKAAENGTYTISFSMDDVEFNYLHLIDNKTGMDIDLLQTSSYTFEANTIDYASRFKLVFSTSNDSNSTVDNDFGFISDGNLMILGIEGTATLQVIDITGRMISNETFNGNYNKALNTKAGVYMLRLIQGNDVRTQKIVVR